MFKTTSMTGTGIFTYFLIWMLQYFEIIVDETAVQGFVIAIIQIVSFTLMVWGQLRRKDMSLFFWRK